MPIPSAARSDSIISSSKGSSAGPNSVTGRVRVDSTLSGQMTMGVGIFPRAGSLAQARPCFTPDSTGSVHVGWLMSRMYDRMLERSERAGLREWRRALLERAHGEVLELGAGTGGNLALYPKGVTRLVLCEPDSHMREMLRRKLAARPDVEVLE